MCMFNKMKEKPCTWVNFYHYNVIEPGKGVVYTKANGAQYMDRTVQKILSVNLEDGETVIKVETDTNILVGPIDKGEGFIPFVGNSYEEESVM